ncbi:MAG: ribosome maturation protein RimP [Sphingomonadaceae bacterium]|nr:ribosome maturation protein RimP [Sphingomonadaceae bacterium]
MADIAALMRLIEPEAEALGLALVRVRFMGGKDDLTLQVMAERPETRQLGLDDCMALSRRLSDRLDEADPIEHAYRLEVSSPGIDRPLTRLTDYDDWAGHDARINLAEPIEGRGHLTGAILCRDGNAITVDVRGHQPMAIDFANIRSAKLVLTDRLILETAPLDPRGADEILTNDAAPEDAELIKQEG